MPSYSSIILDYLGTDIAANRPVSLNIVPTALGIFYATDTGVLSVWEGAAWHTIVASSGASVSEIVAGAGLSGGTITTSGTIAVLADSRFTFNSGTLALANAAASTLFGNSTTASAEPAGTIAIGANLTLSPAGTLSASASGTGTVTQVATSGAGISGGPITGTGTITVEWNGGTVTATGTGLVISSNTLAVDTSTIATTAYADAHDNQLMAAAATTGTLPANTYANGTAGVGATLTGNANGALPAQDGVTLNQFDLLLVKDEAAPAHNGLFEYTTVGNAGAPYVLTRWQNFNQTANINAPMIAIPVRGGTVNSSTQWVVASTVATVGTDPITFTEWGLWQAPKVTALGSGLVLNSGTLTAPAAATYPFSPPVNMPVTTTVNGVGDATAGNVVSFANTATIKAVGWALNSLVNGGSYVAQVCPVNGSNIVQSTTTSATFVASTTAAALVNFSFSSPVVVNPGTNYAISCSRLDGGTTFVLPVFYASAGRVWWRNSEQTGNLGKGIFQNAETSMVNGDTLHSTNAGVYQMTMDVAP